MAYAALPAKIASDTLSLGNYNTIKGNFEAGVPDIFTTKGDIAVATAANAGARLGVGANDSIIVADSGEATGLAYQITPAARVYNNGNIAVAGSTWTTVTCDSERYDSNSCHSTASNTGRLTVPANGDGIYHIGGCVKIDMDEGAGSSLTGLRIYLNGSTVICRRQEEASRGADATWAIGCDYELTAADYVELQFYSASGFDILLDANTSPEFWFHWIRRKVN